MRTLLLFVCVATAAGQTADPAFEPLNRAYEALKTRDYDTAIAGFLQAIAAVPERTAIHTDLAYTYLKIGENVSAREQFHEAMQLDPANIQVALEYGFLCFETKQQAEARRIFDRIRKTGNAVAAQAFENIDRPLAAGIERWTKAIALGADNFSAHFDLAQLAEQRDDLTLAAEHYEKAWRLAPDRRSVLVDLGRVWKRAGKEQDANAALLAASRGGETRAAELARELMPERYPFVPEFHRALELDPKNTGLREELGFLLLKMNRVTEAEQEFRALTTLAPDDYLAAAQLGFLLRARGDKAGAMPLLQRVIDKADEELANRVRAVLRLDQVGEAADPKQLINEAKEMAVRSINAGYLQDAVKYLLAAHEADPGDYDVVLKLGWTNNILHRDKLAYQWFGEARHSPDPAQAAEANRAWKNLHPAVERFRTSGWFYPIFSTRWHDQFGYAQIKTEVTGLPLIPYLSIRFVGDSKQTTGQPAWNGAPQYLSESSFILGGGLRTVPWHGLMGWAEAGSAVGYLTGHMLPDYRGGVNFAKNFGAGLGRETGGAFAGTTLDGVFVSRFGNDFLVYSQSRAGFTLGASSVGAQLYWNGNVTIDDQRQYWANYVETGPGIRFRWASLPPAMYFTVDALRGAYLINRDNPRRPNFNDLRVGMWYAFTR